MKRICVFVSGGGSNLQALIDAVQSDEIKHGYIEVVYSDNKEAYGLDRALKSRIKTITIDRSIFPSQKDYDLELAGKMNSFGIDLICLAGYMKILGKDFIDKFKGDIMNIHPALLPAYGGNGMYGMNVHRAVIANKEKRSGCTVHFVDYGTDTGPIILQKEVDVAPDDTPETLQKKVLVKEHECYKEAVNLFCENKLEIKDGKVIIRD